MDKVERVVPDSTKVFEKTKKPLAGLDKTKSFKPKRKIKEGTRGKDYSALLFCLYKLVANSCLGYGLKQIAKMTIGTGNMQLAVELPAGEDFNEWLAVNTIEFYNESKTANN